MYAIENNRQRNTTEGHLLCIGADIHKAVHNNSQGARDVYRKYQGFPIISCMVHHCIERIIPTTAFVVRWMATGAMSTSFCHFWLILVLNAIIRKYRQHDSICKWFRVTKLLAETIRALVDNLSTPIVVAYYVRCFLFIQNRFAFAFWSKQQLFVSPYLPPNIMMRYHVATAYFYNFRSCIQSLFFYWCQTFSATRPLHWHAFIKTKIPLMTSAAQHFRHIYIHASWLYLQTLNDMGLVI